jgi:hypothetical protein
LHSFLVVDRFDATAMKMESGWNSCQRSLHPIAQIYRILVGVVCKFCVVFARAPAWVLRWREWIALALHPGQDALLPESRVELALPRPSLRPYRERGPIR